MISMKMSEYLSALRSEEPAPGGGSASALAGAQGMALIEMICSLTPPRAKAEEAAAVCEEAGKKANKLFNDIVKLIDADADSFSGFIAACRMPWGTDGQKSERLRAIDAATVQMTEVPMSVLRLAHQGVMLIPGLLGMTNPNAVSDLGVALLSLTACAKGAWLNVRINIPKLKSADDVIKYQNDSDNLYHDIDKISDELYHSIVDSMEV